MFGPRIEADPVRWQASAMIEEAIAAFWTAWPSIRVEVEAEIAPTGSNCEVYGLIVVDRSRKGHDPDRNQVKG